MKVRALAGGFDGVDSYEAGETLEGDTEHIQRLLFNNAAEPLDGQAREFVAKKDEMTDAEVKSHKLHSPAIVEMIANLDVVEETLVRKKGVKKATKKAARSRKR
jgi:hypothetical protein